MCIKIIRWFHCPSIAPDPPPQINQRPPSTNLDKPWLDWKHDGLVHTGEPGEVPKAYQGYCTARHRFEHWIRCARIQVTGCLARPVETRTELYNIACPDCTGDHDCVMSAEPYLTDSEEPDYDIHNRVEMQPTYQYLEELVRLVRAFYKIGLLKETLDKTSWEVFMRGHNCTYNPEHIQRDHPELVPTDDCQRNCPCTFDPGAHNMSRTARNHEGHVVRAIRPMNWFKNCSRDGELQQWKDERFARLPGQLDLNLDLGSYLKWRDMALLVGQQVSTLSNLDFNPDLATSKTPFYQDLSEWRSVLSKREQTCLLLIRYAASDPGITLKFSKSIVKAILPLLAPGLDSSDPRIARLFSATPAVEDEWLLELAALSDQFQPKNKPHFWRDEAKQNQDELFNVITRNCRVTFTNTRARQTVAESVISMYTISGNTVLETGEEADLNCNICGDNFDTRQPTHITVPPHLAVLRLPCCRQFIHARCFKGIATSQSPVCPFCKAEFAAMGMVSDDNDPWRSYNVQYEDFPPGLYGFPSLDQLLQASLEHPVYARLMRSLNRAIEADQPPLLGSENEDMGLGILGFMQ
ncbi:hypothetical protein FGRMN_7395 [Fusarium graminum]|nr:hypothetical protein FGRMN_7395 [Fusarium graminum]